MACLLQETLEAALRPAFVVFALGLVVFLVAFGLLFSFSSESDSSSSSDSSVSVSNSSSDSFFAFLFPFVFASVFDLAFGLAFGLALNIISMRFFFCVTSVTPYSSHTITSPTVRPLSVAISFAQP